MHPESMGLALETFSDGLDKVAQQFDERPADSFDVIARLSPEARARAMERSGPNPKFDVIRKMPRSILECLSFDEICRIRMSTMFTMSASMEEMLEQDPRHVLVDRIRSSMWHWGAGRPTWNELVDAHDGIRRFDLDIPGFECRLDHVNQNRDSGEGEHGSADVWLDGSFAYLVHHRGVHVMTIGFSLSAGRRLLVQQVQMVRSKGNRWLFRMSANRMEHILERFASAFPNHTLHVVDGADLVEKTLRDYRRSLVRLNERIDTIALGTGKDEKQRAGRHRDALEQRDQLTARISHLEGERPRLMAFYQNCGRHGTGMPVSINAMGFRPVYA